MLNQQEIIAVVSIAVGIVSAVAAVLGLSKGRARSILLAVIPLLVVVLLLVIFWHPSSTIIVKQENPAVPVSEITKASLLPIAKDMTSPPTPSTNPEKILQPPSYASVSEKNWRDIQIQQTVRNEYFSTELNNCRRYGSNIFCEFDIGNLRPKELSGLLYCYDEKKNRCYIKGDDGRRYPATEVAGGKVERDAKIRGHHTYLRLTSLASEGTGKGTGTG